MKAKLLRKVRRKVQIRQRGDKYFVYCKYGLKWSEVYKGPDLRMAQDTMRRYLLYAADYMFSGRKLKGRKL